jgi:hypothetical protein
VNAIQGVVRNGHIVLDKPSGLPDGTRVEVVPVDAPRPSFGLREADWPTTPEGIAELLARIDQIEPLIRTAQEEAEWKAALQAQKEAEKAAFAERAETLRRMWE